MSGEITRSPGIPIKVGIATYGFAGGGVTGATDELDATVARAAEMLRCAYGVDVTIRFNSDRASGGAWLVTHAQDAVGRNSEIGLCASVVTERQRRQWAEMIDRYADDAEWVAELRGRLENEPAGTLRVCAHASEVVIHPGILSEGEGYYHREHPSLEDALAFLLANADRPEVVS